MFPVTGPLTLLSVLIPVLVLALPHDGHGDHGAVSRALPGAWYHPENHPVHTLFKRDTPTPGSQQWAAQYPTPAPAPIPEALTPPAWLAALQAAEQAGKIPDITIPAATGGNPQYAPGDDPAGPIICSSTWQCRGEGDEWDAPDGHVGIGFDDGPTDGSAKLYQFLQQQGQVATHFMIGVNIVNNYALFNEAFATLQHDIAVHTWTHPYMTTWNNTQVLAQLGWTMQIIHDSTGGRVPRYWRPPMGDSDNRVRAIAREVFGITQVDWNHDSEDWSMATGQTTLPKVEAAINGWYAGPKSPGLIILEHELTNDTSGGFMDTYPTLKANGWIPISTLQLFNGSYKNADGASGDVQSMDVLGSQTAASSSSSASESGTTSTGATSTDGPSASPAPSQSQGASNNNNKGGSSGAQYVRHVGPWTLLALAGTLVLSLR